MNMGSIISARRKELGITQESLAQQLGVSNQAVSKWESDQCCPDIALLPRLADIFDTSIDSLFGRQGPEASALSLPWKNDRALYVPLFRGHELLAWGCAEARDLTFTYEGPALNVTSAVSVKCQDVGGDVNASGSVTCCDVSGDINTSGNVICCDIGGDVTAGGEVICCDVGGDIEAGGSVHIQNP